MLAWVRLIWRRLVDVIVALVGMIEGLVVGGAVGVWQDPADDNPRAQRECTPVIIESSRSSVFWAQG